MAEQAAPVEPSAGATEYGATEYAKSQEAACEGDAGCAALLACLNIADVCTDTQTTDAGAACASHCTSCSLDDACAVAWHHDAKDQTCAANPKCSKFQACVGASGHRRLEGADDLPGGHLASWWLSAIERGTSPADTERLKPPDDPQERF